MPPTGNYRRGPGGETTPAQPLKVAKTEGTTPETAETTRTAARATGENFCAYRLRRRL